jgi:xanthine dehydrogenase large subunit
MKNLNNLAYEVTYYQNAGAYADLSTPILERTMFHCTNSYFIPNVKAKGISCRTNLAPNTAFRGFGGPQAMFVMESAIFEAASKLNVPARLIQELNLIRQDETFPYGMNARSDKAVHCWRLADEKFNITEKTEKVETFNKTCSHLKKGLAMIPVCFGISFTNTMLNQAGALVHVYNDGSISVSTGAVEMGQGVNAKIRKVAATVFSVSEDRIRIESTNTSRIANISPTAASTGADLNGNATRLACQEILSRLIQALPCFLNTNTDDAFEVRDEVLYHNGKPTKLTWDELIGKAYQRADFTFSTCILRHSGHITLTGQKKREHLCLSCERNRHH